MRALLSEERWRVMDTGKLLHHLYSKVLLSQLSLEYIKVFF